MSTTRLELPDEIKGLFEPYETIDVIDRRYMADPQFVEGYPGWQESNHPFSSQLTDNEGRTWTVRTFSPTRATGCERGQYIVYYGLNS
jgi:hypothetical protein